MAGEITGSARGIGTQFGGEVGYRISVGHAEFKPFVGLDVMRFYRAGYTETQEVGLTYPSQTFTKVISKVGAALSAQFQAYGATYMPGARAAWGRDLHNTTLVTQAALFDTAFETPAANPGRDAALIDLSLTAWRSEKLRLFASLGAEIRQNAVSHQVAGGFRYSW
jgi:outer membrane autotransporter protein